MLRPNERNRHVDRGRVINTRKANRGTFGDRGGALRRNETTAGFRVHPVGGRGTGGGA